MIDIQYINDLEAEMDIMKLVDNYNEIKSILQQYPQEQWSYEMILAFARALNYLQDYSDQINPFEQAYGLLQTVSDKGMTDHEWHLIMASVSLVLVRCCFFLWISLKLILQKVMIFQLKNRVKSTTPV
ncbi:hypothetical protein [Paenibacillus periandrae]|uniref:hypothetical protein n=1 Tax=Paenibacillus periandrae TaxID=1761741 RepID=UPI001F093A13|nr:hypothetical protein [Paenibacillus periandrae]